jgi:hypothetical protein
VVGGATAPLHRLSLDFWGLTASDSARGYVAWGTPAPDGDDPSDGTVVPCAPGGSLPFAPAECVTALRTLRAIGGPRAWGRYGFVDAFNPHTGWAATDVIGINVGITLIMAENLRTHRPRVGPIHGGARSATREAARRRLRLERLRRALIARTAPAAGE